MGCRIDQRRCDNVSEPPSSMFRAAPKNALGLESVGIDARPRALWPMAEQSFVGAREP